MSPEMEQKIERMKEEERILKNEITEKTFGYFTTALGVVAGLAWNEAIKGLIDFWLPLDAQGVLIKFLYALMVTVLAVLVGYYGSRILKRRS